jgi:HEAT repeat protein
MMDKKKKLAILRSLNEARLRREVLIPLFEHMEFEDVIEYHGGSSEKGKDIIYYKTDPFDRKKYTSVVVKKDNISGTVSKPTGAKEVLFQVEQSFDEPYTDIYGLKQVEMDFCIVATAGKIINTAVESIRGRLKKSNLDKLVDFIDGGKLVDLMDKHMPGYFFDEYEKFNTYFKAMKEDFEKIKDVTAIGQRQTIQLEEIYVSLKVSQTQSLVEPEIPDEIKAEIKSRGKPHDEEMAAWEAAHMVKHERVMDADKAVDEFPRLVMVGAPGAGKTTLLKHLALKTCKKNLDQKEHVLVPIWITLRELVQCESHCLRDYIDTVFEKYKFPNAKESVEKDLGEGKCLLLLDGFDELATLENQNKVASDIQDFIRQYPRCRMAITSRIAGYRDQLNGFTKLEVMEFDEKQVVTFIKNWFGGPHKSKARSMTKAVKENESIGKLAKNPLMISIISIIYEEDRELPQRRVELYKRAAEVLLSRWDKQKQFENKYKADQKEFILKKLAIDNHTHQRRVMKEGTVLSMIHRHAAQIGLEEKEAKRFLEEIWQRSYLLRQIALQEYDFLHLSFQEYFTALELKNREKGMDIIIENITDPWWEEPVLLYAGLSKDAAPLIRRIQEEVPEDRFYSQLMLSGKCIADAEFTEPELKDAVVDKLWYLNGEGEFLLRRNQAREVLSRIKPIRLINRLTGELSAKDPNVRWRAAGALGEIGGSKTFATLVEAIKSNEDKDVRCRAISALGDIGDNESVAALIDFINKYEDSDFFWRAIDTLGLIGNNNAISTLIDILRNHKSVLARWHAAEALQSFNSSVAISALINTMKTDDDNSVRYQAADTLGVISAIETVPALIDTINTSEDFILRQSAIRALGNIGDNKAVPTLINTMHTDKGHLVDLCAISALGRIGGSVAVSALIEMMNTSERSSLRVGATKALGHIEDTEAISTLIVAMKTHEDNEVRGNAAVALGKMGYGEAVSVLIDTLKSSRDYYLRSEAALTLGEIGGSDSVKVLINVLKNDEYRDVRVDAASALGRIGGSEAVSALIDALNSKDESGHVRKSAASALGIIGNKTALHTLERAIRYDRDAQNAAFEAIYKIEKRRKIRRKEGKKEG